MDRVFVNNLSLRGKHGVHAHERITEQEFLIDIVAQFDASRAAKSDRIEDTVNYSHFVRIARSAVERNSFYLIECLAETIALEILEDKRIISVEVRVRKPAALENGIPGVTIVRP